MALALLISGSATRLAATDEQLLAQLGYVAGQAVACNIEEPAVAAKVATAMADAMGLTDVGSHHTLSAAAQPCAAPRDRFEEMRTNWRAMRGRAGLDAE